MYTGVAVRFLEILYSKDLPVVITESAVLKFLCTDSSINPNYDDTRMNVLWRVVRRRTRAAVA